MDEVAEQTGAAPPEQPEAGPEQIASVPEPVATGAETEGAPEPSAEPAREPAESRLFGSDADIAAALEREPQLAAFIEKTKADGRNEGVQAELARIKREAGTRERVQQAEERFLKRFADRLGLDFDEVRTNWRDPESKDFAFTSELAEQRAISEIGMGWLAASADHFGLDAASRDTLLEAAQGMDSEQIASHASTLLTKLREQDTERIKAEVEASFKERVAAEVDKELKAREVAGRDRPENPPRASDGAPAAGAITRESISQMTPEQINANWDAISEALKSRRLGSESPAHA